MDRWRGILKVPRNPNDKAQYRVAASLCLSPSKTLAVSSTNVIFFNGDRVQGTGNPVIERLSDLQHIAEILVLKFGVSINAWVIEASNYNGSFAVYKDFVPSVNRYGEPKSYEATGFPASTSTVRLLSNCLKEAVRVISLGQKQPCLPVVSHSFSSCQPKTIVVGFSKGGTILNQLVTELGYSEVKPTDVNEQRISENASVQAQDLIIPTSKEGLLESIAEIHYVDVGLNTEGAYLTDRSVFERISRRFLRPESRIRFVLHGTPRQWSDSWRDFIKKEKDQMVQLLESKAQKCGGRLSVQEKLYFAGSPPTLQMHFQVIEELDVR